MKANIQTEQAVLDVLGKMGEAYQSRSAETLLSVIAPDTDVIMYGTGADEKRIGRDEMLELAERDWSQTDEAEFRFYWSSVSACGPVAWVAADIAFALVVGGQSMEWPARMTAVLEHRDNEWLIVQSHFSAPAAQEEGESFPA
jgi:ketosteroid isomerase-like protein